MNKVLLLGLSLVRTRFNRVLITKVKVHSNYLANMSRNKSSSSGTGTGKNVYKKVSGKSQKIESCSTASLTKAVNVASNGDIQISIHVKPGAKSNCITDVCNDYWSVQISAPPTDGEANAGVIKFFSELLNLKKSDIGLRGGKSRDKVISITSASGHALTCEKVTELLKAEIGKIY